MLQTARASLKPGSRPRMVASARYGAKIAAPTRDKISVFLLAVGCVCT